MKTNKINTQLIEKELGKRFKTDQYYSIANFKDDAKRYIKAITEGRMICNIGSVSKSGMSRTIKFLEMVKEKKGNRHYMLNFYGLFRMLGYSQIKNSDYFRINGCGMDMIFHTNYGIISDLYRYGFITEKERDDLRQSRIHNI